jgi:hypothetical protein
MAKVDFEIRWMFKNEQFIEVQYYPKLDLPEKFLREYGGRFAIPANKMKNSDQGRMINAIFNEVFTKRPNNRLVEVMGKQHEISTHLRSIKHYASTTFLGLTPDIEVDIRDILSCSSYEKLLGKQTPSSYSIRVQILSKMNQENLRKLDSWIYDKVRENFKLHLTDDLLERFPELKKINVFISLRGRVVPKGEYLHKKLSSYANNTMFEPYIYTLDMKPGQWIQQIEDNIEDCNIFLPLLTLDYFEGSVSVQEHNQAMRKAETIASMTIVPVIIEGKINDYSSGFVGNYTFKELPFDTNSDDYEEQFEKLVRFISQRPYSR